MATVPIAIPKASQAVTEGTISEWMVADGARVTAGQVIYRLETEKVEMDIEAPTTGTIHITGPAGQAYAVGTVVGNIEGDQP